MCCSLASLELTNAVQLTRTCSCTSLTFKTSGNTAIQETRCKHHVSEQRQKEYALNNCPRRPIGMCLEGIPKAVHKHGEWSTVSGIPPSVSTVCKIPPSMSTVSGIPPSVSTVSGIPRRGFGGAGPAPGKLANAITMANYPQQHTCATIYMIVK